MTSEDQTLTVLAPASLTYPPSVVSLNSAPTSPLSPFLGFPEFTGIIGGGKHGSAMQRVNSAPLASQNQKQNFDGGARSISLNELASPQSDVIPSSGFGCTHLWLQSRVPLGYFLFSFSLVVFNCSTSNYYNLLWSYQMCSFSLYRHSQA